MNRTEWRERMQGAGILCSPEYSIFRGEPANGPTPAWAAYFSRVLRRCPDINVIMVSTAPYTRACAERGNPLKPYLDDAAQLLGLRVPVVRQPPCWPSSRYPAFLVPGLGAVCLASNLYDLEAIALVCEKLAVAAVAAELFHAPRCIPWYEAVLMRGIYRRSYGRKAGAGRDWAEDGTA